MGQMMGGMMQNMMGQMMQGVMMQMMGKLGMPIPNMNAQSPQQMMGQIMQNQQVQSVAGPFINGKSPEQLSETFQNMCMERGVDPAAFAQKMGVTLPK